NTLFDYFPAKTPVFFMGTNEVTASYKAEWESEREQIERLIVEGVLEEKYAGSLSDEKTFTEILSRAVPVHLNAFGGGSFQKEGGLFGFRCRRLPTYADSPKALLDDLSSYLKLSYTVLLVCETSAEAARLRAYLTDAGYQAVIAPEGLTPENAVPGVVYLLSGWDLSSGYELLTPRLAVLSTLHGNAAASPRRLSQGRKRRFTPGRTILSYLELKPGDLVVHEKYGIGRFTGIETLRQDGVCRDYITIQYAGTDRLFIPADALDAVTKYVGGEDGKVPLSKMGGTAWTKTKSRAKAAAKEMAQELIALYAARMREPGIAFPREEEMETEFAGNFPYELTECQAQALEDIFRDMEKPTPMDRLLCGDVGYGKTEVALRAAFRAIANGKQVAILVPTTILALQHYETAVSRMRGFAVKVDMLSRMRTPREQAAVRRRVARGETDLIIGTHSLLAGSITFKRLGLLIVDEEQRFGVAQKEKIKSFAKDIDVLTLTATPIPRTLNMAVGGIRDLSVLDLAPGDRRPVETYVLEYAEEPIFSAIRKELARAGQVLYLYNRVETIDLVAGRVQKAFPGARVAYAHGQMERGVVEDIWQALVRGEIDILICTTIIETGVDLPNANTLIIEDADRLGLAQLHQIRGRIGRSSRQAYAYLTYRRGKALSEESRKRLEALREYTEFGAGFRIALRDMEIRGAGDLLGASQHGHIESVGYDLYVRLLEEAILDERGEAKAVPFESKVDLKVDAYLPETYIAASRHRMEFYKKISLIETEDDRRDVLDELCDRFGDPPRPAVDLTYIALARATAARCRVSSVTRDARNLLVTPERVSPELLAELFHRFDGFRAPRTAAAAISLPLTNVKNVAAAAAEMMTTYADAYDAATKAKEELTVARQDAQDKPE
ncbi:MAG: transcription-repair coupling factor, partial [Eubacteriales bacterium]|nr:transcription-repair coupling factor [Eubacteriales bacterium]